MEQIPNLSEKSGVSLDYEYEFGNVKNYIEKVANDEPPRWLFLAKRTFVQRQVLRYDQAFDPEKYENVITEGNKKSVGKLDEIVASLNEIREEAADGPRNAKLDMDKIEVLYNSAIKVIKNGVNSSE